MTTLTSTDAELVAAALGGERSAFAEIVARYGGMVSGVAYSICGDLPTSEDLAQETFLAAWRDLRGLREPAKLGAWLCGIARHRTQEALRRSGRQPRTASTIAAAAALPATDPSPLHAAMTHEEQALLWRTLEQLEQPYRETLVLYYRQQQSTAAVAKSLGVSEEAVRQRLARGRAMLRERMVVFVERALECSGPRPVFTLAVLAALPMGVAPTATVTAGVVAKSVAAAKGIAWLLPLSLLAGPLAAVAGGIGGARQGFREARSARERQAIVQRIAAIAACTVLGIAVLVGITAYRYELGREGFIIAQCIVWASYMGLQVIITARFQRAMHEIRTQEGLPPGAPALPRRTGTPRRIYLPLIAGTGAPLVWMVVMAAQSGDWISAVLVTLAGVAMFILAARAWARGQGRVFRRMMIWISAGLAAIYFLVFNLRLVYWTAARTGRTVEQARQSLGPLWGMNLLLIVIFLGMAALFWVATGREKPEPAPRAPRLS